LPCSAQRDGPNCYFEYEIGTKYARGKGARKGISEAAYKESGSFVEEDTSKGIFGM
jgi:hypothetical protein